MSSFALYAVLSKNINVVYYNNYIDRKGGKCEAIPAPFGVFLEENDENYVEPDLSVICDTAKLQDDGCHGTPDWVIEIVSPASRKMDCFIKQEKYRKAGVREYWIVDPETNIIRVFRYEKGEMKDYPFTEDIPVGIYEDLTINLSKLL
ncbi:MAG: Uma2 family endonuclease [Lachnospiraceae bacterium]|nr:Uma2 family endonuclease [Lachnospiraceae bacterium]MBO6297771.1 Uma2 family endonuclease [Lachnospiraceae bacterium]